MASKARAFKRSNSFVDIEFTLKRQFKKTSFRYFHLGSFFSWVDMPQLTHEPGPSKQRSSMLPLTERMYWYKPQRPLARAFAFNYLLLSMKGVSTMSRFFEARKARC